MLVVAVLAFAFLAASFPAVNSDLWRHLAAGRLLRSGDYTFGADPFAYTTQGVYWVNHSWLFDLASYLAYTHLGGPWLVALKALLATALVGVLLLGVRRPGGLGISVACMALAILSMSPFLQLRPVCGSYVLLGLTFWILWRVTEEPNTTGSRRLLLAVPFLFALWVNLDSWFLLGPVLAGLFWAGERLQGRRTVPGWLVVAAVAACLGNPHGYRAFRLPDEVAPVTWSSGLRDDVRFRPLFSSPSGLPVFRAADEINLPLLAYYLLNLLSLASLLFVRGGLRSWRFLVWAPFALLAASQAWAVPFFAVVAAPIASLGIQECCTKLADTGGGRLLNAAGSLAVLVACLGLIVLTWPGWLSGVRHERQRVGWAVVPDPTLRHAAEVLHGWHVQGKLTDLDRTFAFHPAVAAYCAWFCPQSKQFFDTRYGLFGEAAGEYERVVQGLDRPLPIASSPQPPAEGWEQVLQERGVTNLVLYDPDPRRVDAALGRLLEDTGKWSLLDIAGRVWLFGWKEGRKGHERGFRELAFDPERLAYGPQTSAAAPAHTDAEDRLLEPRVGGQRYWKGMLPRTWESEAAPMYLALFHAVARHLLPQAEREYRSLFAAARAGAVALPSGLAAPAADLVFRTVFQGVLARDGRDAPPALALLAVRLARRALAANPEDANAYFALGQAYLALRDSTLEHGSEGRLPPLAVLRHVQIATALERALVLQPDLAEAHQILATIYEQQGFLDIALDHRNDQVRLARKAGPAAGEAPKAFADRLKQFEESAAVFETRVRTLQNEYAFRSVSLRGEPVQQAKLALRMGLPRQAVDEVLLAAPAELLGPEGIRLELELLLVLGQPERVKAALSGPEAEAHKGKLPPQVLPPPRQLFGGPLYTTNYVFPSYDWFGAVRAAAVGDYANVSRALTSLRAALQAAASEAEELGRVGMGMGLQLLAPHTGVTTLPAAWLASRPQWDAIALAATHDSLRSQQADTLVLQALLLLEEGLPVAAQRLLDDAGALQPRPWPFAGRPLAEYYLGRPYTPRKEEAVKAVLRRL
jgi:tetratricopeptide (TPR) repeat protein